MKRKIGIVIGVLLIAMMMSGVALADTGKQAKGQQMTVSGTINNMKQLVDNTGQVFKIAQTDKGNELVSQVKQNQKVEVTGTVMESKGEKTIDVKSYKVIGKK